MNLLVILKNSKLSRFISLGFVNTLFTFFLYQLLLFFLSPKLAYSISWIIGFLFLVLLYPKYVFGTFVNIFSIFLISVIYMSSLLVGVILLEFIHELYLHHRVSIVIVIVITSTYNFLLMNFFLVRMNVRK